MSVVNQDGELMGEMPTDKARVMAAEAGLDLVEVAPDARPPVCRIMDYGKSKYKRKKRQDGGGTALGHTPGGNQRRSATPVLHPALPGQHECNADTTGGELS